MSTSIKDQLAVALHYDKGGAPRVVAKGRGSLGAKIIEVAKAHDVPIASERTVQPTPIEPPVTPAPPPLADDLPIIPPEPAPAVQPLPAESAPATGDSGQPVTLLKGLGPKVASRLAELGITTVGQLAALSPGEADALDGELGTFSGRMTRDRWIEQAQLLAAGDRAGYEATFGKLG